MKIYIFILTFFISVNCHSQETSENTENKSPAPVPLNAEKIAWEMMYPSTYKKTAKPTHIKLYEEVLLKMKAGTAKLSLVIGKFKIETSTSISHKENI